MLKSHPKNSFIFFAIFVFSLLFFSDFYLANIAKAVEWNFSVPNNLVNFSGGSQPKNVFAFVFLVSDWLLNIAGTLIVILIIYSGVRFVLSRGNPGEIGKAKTTLWWAIAGFTVVLIGKGFVFIIEGVLKNQ